MSGGRSISVGAQHAAPLPHRSARHLVEPLVDYVFGMKLVLFDIDGTLLWTDGAGRRAIQRALVDEAGTAGPIETYRFDGKTDPQIVRDLLSLAGHSGAENPTVIQAVCRRYVEHLRTELERPTQATRLMVGIADLLAALEPHETQGRALVGLLTGNVAPGAALKLRSAGLDPARFRVGAYGSDSARRAELPAVAAGRAAALTGATFTGSDVRSEEHTSELQSRVDLVCRLLLEKKKTLASADDQTD